MASPILSVGNSGPVLLGTVTAAQVISAPVTSAPLMLEARRMKKWQFMLGGTFANFSVLINGTIDANTSGFIGYANTPPNSNWFPIPGQTVQSGTGLEVNPLTLVTQSLTYGGTLFAVQFVASQAQSQTATGTCLIFGLAVP
jgi:hypothetical protein